jgi:hypothetical protein
MLAALAFANRYPFNPWQVRRICANHDWGLKLAGTWHVEIDEFSKFADMVDRGDASFDSSEKFASSLANGPQLDENKHVGKSFTEEDDRDQGRETTRTSPRRSRRDQSWADGAGRVQSRSVRELADSEQLIHADQIARHRDPVPRKNLEENDVDLWVFERTEQLVNDQDAVVEGSDERGFIPASAHGLSNHPVVRRPFRQVRYLKPSDREYADPLRSVLRLPRFDAPGMLFDFGHKTEPTQRRELVELIPVPDAPAKPAKSPDGRM